MKQPRTNKLAAWSECNNNTAHTSMRVSLTLSAGVWCLIKSVAQSKVAAAAAVLSDSEKGRADKRSFAACSHGVLIMVAASEAKRNSVKAKKSRHLQAPTSKYILYPLAAPYNFMDGAETIRVAGERLPWKGWNPSHFIQRDERNIQIYVQLIERRSNANTKGGRHIL